MMFTRTYHITQSCLVGSGAFSHAVHSKGAALSNFWGLIYATVRPVARPSRSQSILYSGHKRVHCLKFQVWYSTTCSHGKDMFSVIIGHP